MIDPTNTEGRIELYKALFELAMGIKEMAQASRQIAIAGLSQMENDSDAAMDAYKEMSARLDATDERMSALCDSMLSKNG